MLKSDYHIYTFYNFYKKSYILKNKNNNKFVDFIDKMIEMLIKNNYWIISYEIRNIIRSKNYNIKNYINNLFKDRLLKILSNKNINEQVRKNVFDKEIAYFIKLLLRNNEISELKYLILDIPRGSLIFDS